MQVRSNDGTSGMGMQAYAGLYSKIYTSNGFVFTTGATLRDKDYPTGGTTRATLDSAGLTVTGIANVSSTLAAGNTTITGFANVSTTLQVGTNTATFGTAAYVVANGNVGIGTSSPGYKLDVSSAGTTLARYTGAQYSQVQHSDGTRALYTQVYDNVAVLGTATSTPLTFAPNNTERMRITSAGDVGIGTASPGTKLEVSSTSAGATAEVLRLNNPGAGANTAAQIKFFAAGTNYASITGGYGAAAAQMTFNMPTASAGNYVWQGNSVEQMRLDASGNLLVGATANPGVLNTSVVINSGANSLAGIVLQNNATGSGSTDGSHITIAATDLIISNAENAPIFFKTNGTESMRITSAGSVGIGTSAPSARFAVVPTSNPTSATGGLQTSIGEASDNAAYQMRMGYMYDTVAGTYKGVINTISGGVGADLLLNPSGGAVGIGTSSPAAKLDVVGNVRISTGSSFYWGDGTTQIVGDNAGPMRFLTGTASEKMRIEAGGNVGIGTTAPGYTLEVNGSFATGGLSISNTGVVLSANTAAAVGYKGLPQNSQTAAYGLALDDMGKMINTTTGGVVIPANANVAFPLGSTIVIYNNSASSQTISITTDTMYLAGSATTGSRTLAQRGLATCVKVTANNWVISGAGVT